MGDVRERAYPGEVLTGLLLEIGNEVKKLRHEAPEKVSNGNHQKEFVT